VEQRQALGGALERAPEASPEAAPEAAVDRALEAAPVLAPASKVGRIRPVGVARQRGVRRGVRIFIVNG